MADTTEEKMEIVSLREIHQMLRIDESSLTPMKVVALQSEWNKLMAIGMKIIVSDDEEKVRALRIDFANQRRVVLDLMFHIFHDCRVMEIEDNEPA